MGCCIGVNLRLKVRFSLDQKPSNTILQYWNGPRDMECCIGVDLRLKVRFSRDQKHSNTILEWPERDGMLHWCEFAIESTVFS